MKLEFYRQIVEKNTKIPNFVIIRPVGAESFHADRRTDMTKLIVDFRGFSNETKNDIINSDNIICYFHR